MRYGGQSYNIQGGLGIDKGVSSVLQQYNDCEICLATKTFRKHLCEYVTQ